MDSRDDFVLSWQHVHLALFLFHNLSCSPLRFTPMSRQASAMRVREDGRMLLELLEGSSVQLCGVVQLKPIALRALTCFLIRNFDSEH